MSITFKCLSAVNLEEFYIKIFQNPTFNNNHNIHIWLWMWLFGCMWGTLAWSILVGFGSSQWFVLQVCWHSLTSFTLLVDTEGSPSRKLFGVFLQNVQMFASLSCAWSQCQLSTVSKGIYWGFTCARWVSAVQLSLGCTPPASIISKQKHRHIF